MFIPILILLFSQNAKSQTIFHAARDSYQSALLYRDCKILLQTNCKKLPEMVQIQVDMCKATYTANKCEERKAKDEEQWRYLDCNPYALCQMAVDLHASSNACFVGLLELPRAVGEGAISGYKSVRDYVKTFDSEKASQLKNKAHKLIELETYTGLNEKVKEQVQSLSKKRIDIEQAWIIVRDFFNDTKSDYQCLSSNEKQRIKCSILADILSGVAVEKALAKGGAMALKKTTAKTGTSKTLSTEVLAEARSTEVKLANIAKSSDKKRFIVEQYGTKNVTTETENVNWKKFIENPGKRHKSVTIENINLKELNDKIFKDEQYVTSITNLYKEMQMDKLKALEKTIQKTNPNFKFNYFSDFKTVRVAYDDIDGVDVSKLLNQELGATNKEFADFTLKENLVRTNDNPAGWFKASSHTSDDMTNLVSRYSRENPNEYFIDGASDPKFKSWADERFNQAKTLHAKVLGEYKGTDLIQQTPGGPAVNRDLFEIMRKNKDPKTAKAEIERTFGLQKIEDSKYQDLRDYFDRADNFAPGLRNTKREFATLADATHGGVSIDMIGLGADHIQSTSSMALNGSKNIDELLKMSRKNEQVLTDEINRRKKVIEEKFKEITGDSKSVVTCSGDGCKAYVPGRPLTKKETDSFADAVTQGREEGKLRFSTVTKMDDATMYDYVAKQGEEVEKLVRKKLAASGAIEPKRLKGMNFTVNITTTDAKHGTASLHTSRVNSLAASASENKKIQDALKQVVKELEYNYTTGL